MALGLLASAMLAVCAPGPRSHCVHDGDTIWLSGEKIRIADIDAPELNGRCTYESALARRARARLVSLLNSGPISLRRTGRDRYGRTLAIVMRDNRSLGDMLVSEGLARPWIGRREPWC